MSGRPLPADARRTRTNRVIETLALFSERQPSLTALDIADRLGVARATAYRCIGDLLAGGLIEGAGQGQYVLGPAIVELDRCIRRSDPLIHAATPVMQLLAEQSQGHVLLCRLHGRKVLCVHHQIGKATPNSVSYERGRAMPLFRGATSRAILAHLPLAELVSLAREQAQDLKAAGLPREAGALAAWLAEERKLKVWHSVGEVDVGAEGWAVPLHHKQTLLGSLSVVLDTRKVQGRAAQIANLVHRAGLRIEARVEA